MAETESDQTEAEDGAPTEHRKVEDYLASQAWEERLAEARARREKVLAERQASGQFDPNRPSVRPIPVAQGDPRQGAALIPPKVPQTAAAADVPRRGARPAVLLTAAAGALGIGVLGALFWAGQDPVAVGGDRSAAVEPADPSVATPPETAANAPMPDAAPPDFPAVPPVDLAALDAAPRPTLPPSDTSQAGAEAEPAPQSGPDRPQFGDAGPWALPETRAVGPGGAEGISVTTGAMLWQRGRVPADAPAAELGFRLSSPTPNGATGPLVPAIPPALAAATRNTSPSSSLRPEGPAPRLAFAEAPPMGSAPVVAATRSQLPPPEVPAGPPRGPDDVGRPDVLPQVEGIVAAEPADDVARDVAESLLRDAALPARPAQPAEAAEPAPLGEVAISDPGAYRLTVHAGSDAAASAMHDRLFAAGFSSIDATVAPFAWPATTVFYFHDRDRDAARGIASLLGGTVAAATGIVPSPPAGRIDIHVGD